MRFMKYVCFLYFLLLTPVLSLADMPTLPSVSAVIPAPPPLAAKSYLLIDYWSDYVIAEQDVDKPLEPASLTKMMTAYVVDQAIFSNKIKLSDKVKISPEAWRAEGSRMFVNVDSEVSVEDLLKGVIIQSGNDASIALAEHIAGTESAFANLMNAYAAQLGMVNTHFVNSTGLSDPNHYTTARDIAILAKALIRDFPESYALYSQKEFTYQDIKQTNRNRLLWKNDIVDGIKTGHTEAAGFCLVASGQKENMRLIAVVMGTKSDDARTDETNKLLTYGFRFFETRKLYPAKIALKQTRVWQGKEKEANLGLKEDLHVTIGHGQYDKLKANIVINEVVRAPLAEGTPVGTLSVQLDDKLLIERPVVALQTIEGAGFAKRMYEGGILGVKSIWNKVFN